MDRSYLFAPGHNAKLLRVFEAGADAVMLDLEDAVPPTPRTRPGMVAEALVDPRLGRVNAARTEVRGRPRAVGRAFGIRIPKAESADDVRWVAERAPASRSSARSRAPGVLAAAEIAPRRGAAPGHGGVDLQNDLKRTEPPDPVRPLPPGGRVPGGRPGAADRQRLPQARRRGGLRGRPSSPARSALRQVGHPSTPAARPPPGVHPSEGSSAGPARSWRLRGRRRRRAPAARRGVRRPAGGATRPPSAGVGGHTLLTGEAA